MSRSKDLNRVRCMTHVEDSSIEHGPSAPEPGEVDPLIDEIIQRSDAGCSRVQAIVEVWEAHDVQDVDTFLRSIAERLDLSRSEARLTSRRLRPPWEKRLRPS